MPDEREWLEADGLGGFAMGTVCGIRTRRYHALLTTATSPPTGRVVLVAGLEAWIESDGGEPIALSSHRYAPDVLHPDGHRRIVGFEHLPWPRWTLQVDDATTVDFELVCHRPTGDVSLTWRLSSGPVRRLRVRPLLAVRDYHSLEPMNPTFDLSATTVGRGGTKNVSFRPARDRPAVTVLSSGDYEHAPTWYHQFLYTAERARGLDCQDDLASPGVFHLELDPSRSAVMVLRAGDAPFGNAEAVAADQRHAERERRADAIEAAVDTYLVARGNGLTVIAGYPWFTDWGRDTFIALRGLCLAPGRGLERRNQARRVLRAWADAVTEGMIPNRFTDAGDAPELNAVDASLWFVVAAGELMGDGELSASDHAALRDAIVAIVSGYRAGTRYNIRCDDDGLIAAGAPGVQLTWMDAKVDGDVITPRIGKPVEVQALWINALAIAERFEPALRELRERATASFRHRFIRSDGSLFDVVDADHIGGNDDATFRPNQIFSVGGLPIAMLEGDPARAVVDQVEERLWTPRGLRSLDPADPAYAPSYRGGPRARDEAYHQGTVWTWLAGPFIEAWLRVRGDTPTVRAEARERFFDPLWASREASFGHLAEIADGDRPHAPRGAPFQAWSLGELLRVRALLADDGERP